MTLLDDVRLVTPDGVIRGWLETQDSRIAALCPGQPPRPADRSLGGDLVVPGFVDIHVHGGGGGLYASGDQAVAVEAAATHRRHGTTTTMASLIAADEHTLTSSIAALADLVEDGVLAGIHLEGPFLATSKHGAHDPAMLRAPEPELVGRLLDAGGGAVAMVTIAPELPDAGDAVRRIVDAGAVAAIGHTDATYAETRQAIEAGATVATHLLNRMRPVHHREPGPVPALLEDDRVVVELICDGVHTHPAVIRMILRHVGSGRVSLITDAIAAAGLADSDGDYLIGGVPTRVENGVSRLLANGALAGSTLTMDRALKFLVTAGFDITDAVRSTSTTPARVLGISDKVGSLTPGRDADLVVLDDDLNPKAVMAKGQWAYT